MRVALVNLPRLITRRKKILLCLKDQDLNTKKQQRLFGRQYLGFEASKKGVFLGLIVLEISSEELHEIVAKAHFAFVRLA